jgi:hypothetical protein
MSLPVIWHTRLEFCLKENGRVLATGASSFEHTGQFRLCVLSSRHSLHASEHGVRSLRVCVFLLCVCACVCVYVCVYIACVFLLCVCVCVCMYVCIVYG